MAPSHAPLRSRSLASRSGRKPRSAGGRWPFPVLLIALALAMFVPSVRTLPPASTGAVTGWRHAVLCDFESGSVTLQSYETEDRDPSDWSVQSGNTYAGTDYALRLYGNTWKSLAIAPYPITEATVFQAAIYAEELGEMQAVGFGDASGNILFYCVSGSQVNLSDRWNVVYQGAFPREAWRAYRLPLGQDWFDTWGYEPDIDHIVFVNDRDQTTRGATVFDEIYDVTEDLPVAPLVEIRTLAGAAQKLPGGELYRLDVQFQSLVFDPDSESHAYAWDFGDGATSSEANPTHSFTATAEHTFTVSLDVSDDTGLFGRDTCQVAVEPGPGAAEISVNFTGDIFMGRGYDQPGGLIDTYGVEYLWQPTLAMLGQAAQLTMVNAECPYTDRGTPHPTKSVVFRARPENIAGFAYAGVDIASTANNHIVDYGLEGLLQTHDLLDSLGIVHGGSGVNAYFAQQPCFIALDGIRLAFVNQCNRTGRQYNEQPFLDAGYDKCGLGYWLEPNIARAIAQADSLGDVVIAFPHSGEEYATSPPAEKNADGALIDPPVVEAEICPPFVPEEEAPEVFFRIWPGASDRQLRYQAIDLGADAVLNSHPHVLQGFEVYQGALIAHSLGNFMFDLYYPETMPTIVLRARVAKEGILAWTFKPAFIDQWVPTPASGRLGREILDRLADYSRQMNTWVGVDPAVLTGTVFLDPADAELLVYAASGSQTFAHSGEYYVSRPLGLQGNGSLSRITELAGIDPGCEVRWGREVLWFGGFEEAEGHHLWDLNSEDEWLDESVYHESEHALALRRSSAPGSIVTTLTKHLPAADSLEYSLTGWMKTEAAQGAKFSVRFYSQRYSSLALATVDMGSAINGESDWTWYSRDLTPPENTHFFNIRCNLDGSQGGDAFAWFDDLRVIEWEPWQPLTLPMAVPYPNNYRCLQLRTTSPASAALVTYEETLLSDSGASRLPEAEPRPVDVLMRPAAPNPFQTEAALRFRLSASARVDLAIYDVSGRLIDRLIRDEWLRPGWHRLAWTAAHQPAGVYFARLTVNGEPRTQKMILLR